MARHRDGERRRSRSRRCDHTYPSPCGPSLGLGSDCVFLAWYEDNLATQLLATQLLLPAPSGAGCAHVERVQSDQIVRELGVHPARSRSRQPFDETDEASCHACACTSRCGGLQLHGPITAWFYFSFVTAPHRCGYHLPRHRLLWNTVGSLTYKLRPTNR